MMIMINRLVSILLLTTLICIPRIRLFSESLKTFLYGQKIENITFNDINNNQVKFPPGKVTSICFFISDTQRNVQLLNQMFYIIDQLDINKKIYIFLPEIKGGSTLIELNKNLEFIIIPNNKNKNEKQKIFISKGCSKCFSMMILEHNKVKFFRQGYDYYLFKEVLKNITKEKK